MTNREAYLQELNELAATVVMGWRKTADETIYDDAIWFESDGCLEDMPRVIDWQPCQNETQAWMLVDKVLGDEPIGEWEFVLDTLRGKWGAGFVGPYAGFTASATDGRRPIAITQAAILAKGGELPEHVEGLA